MDLIINPIIESVLRPLCSSVDWLQNTDGSPPEQFIVWAEEDNRPTLIGDDHPVAMGSWVQVSIYTRRGLSGTLDPTVKQKEVVAALRAGGFEITQCPPTTVDPSGYYHTVIRAFYGA